MKHLKLILKVVFTIGALIFVFSKIDFESTLKHIAESNKLILLLAFLFYNISQLLSAGRLQLFLNSINIDIHFFANLRLYYVGMFYNLSLPGGIGGDGYKAYLLHKQFNQKVKKIIGQLIIDRVSGLFGLVVLAVLFSAILFDDIWLRMGAILFPIIAFGVYKFIYTRKLKIRSVIVVKTFFLSILIQLIQVVAAWNILLALGIKTDQLVYLLLFLVSSVVAVIPVSIGGLGSRELVYLYGKDLFDIVPSNGIAFAMLFFVITAISSLMGAFISLANFEEVKSKVNEKVSQ